MPLRKQSKPIPVSKKSAQPTRAAKSVKTADAPEAEHQGNHLFEVRRSDIQGRGAFATRTLRKGQRIVQYMGDHISNEEADRRYDETKMRRHHTFLFTLDDDTVIDGAVGGNASIYINHSCDPNCEAVIEDDQIYVHALRTIRPGEELLYDYQYERTGENDEELEKFYKCLCGAENCRGSIMKPAKPVRRKRATAKKSAAKGRKSALEAPGNQRGAKRVKQGR